MLSNNLFLHSRKADENPEGEGTGAGVAVTGHDTSKETSVWGASAAGTTGNDAEAEMHAIEVSVMSVLEADAAEIPEGVEIPHQPEVWVCENRIVFE
jgi:hypothetical protein